MAKIYVCGRCGYRTHHKMKCPSCGFHLEDECVKCYSAKGNCICKLHGVFVSGKHTAKVKVKKTKSAGTTAAKKSKKRKKR